METKGELTKNRIIKTARNLFKYQGYKNTTIDDICKASNVKRGNLYFYFKGKEDLAYAAINDAVAREFPFLERMMGEQADPLKKVEIMIDGMAAHIINEDCKGGWFFGNFALEMGDMHRGIAEAVNLFFVGWRKLLLDNLEEAKKAGSIKSDTDCNAISNLIMSTIEGAILIYKTSKDRESFIKTIETLKSVIYFYKV